MKDEQPEALRLAAEVDEVAQTFPDMAEVSAELRRLHAVNHELLEALKMVMPTLERLKFEADGSYGKNFSVTRAETACRNYVAARAAIAKAEGQA